MLCKKLMGVTFVIYQTRKTGQMDAVRLKALNLRIGRAIQGLGTRDDFKIILEVAACEQEGTPITLKQMLLNLDIPESTLKRRLSRLVRARLIVKRMTANDRRVYCYEITDRARQILTEVTRILRGFNWEQTA